MEKVNYQLFEWIWCCHNKEFSNTKDIFNLNLDLGSSNHQDVPEVPGPNWEALLSAELGVVQGGVLSPMLFKVYL